MRNDNHLVSKLISLLLPSSTLEYQSDNVSFNSDDEQQLFNKYLKTGTVDFHGFTVVEAMKLVPLILNHWWNQELIHRQSIGQLKIWEFGIIRISIDNNW